MLEQTNETENTETQTAEEKEEGIELTDTAEVENTEETIKEPKTLSELLEEHPEVQDEINTMIQKRLNRKEREHQKELSKLNNLENLLNKGLGTNNLSDAENTLREAWKEQGIELPEPTNPGLTDRELSVLGKAEADEIIDLGLEETKKEANRLAIIGYDNLNKKEQVIFDTLSKKLMYEKNKEELKDLGVNPKLLEDKNFKDFSEMFSTKAKLKDIVNLYNKNNKKNYEKMGSMKGTEEKKVKDYYTDEEIRKLSLDDLDDPKVWEAVRKSMTSK